MLKGIGAVAWIWAIRCGIRFIGFMIRERRPKQAPSGPRDIDFPRVPKSCRGIDGPLVYGQGLEAVHRIALEARLGFAKDNRQADEAGGQRPYCRVDSLECWEELARGKRVKSRGFPQGYKVHLFWGEGAPHRPDWVVTNEPP